MSLNLKESDEISSNLDILDNIRTAIIIIDSNFDYMYRNVAADDILGSAKILKKIDELPCDDISLITHINNVVQKNQSIMLRDLKFKNFDRIEKICDCNISQCVLNSNRCILIEFNRYYC